jgi:hypothetical protein
MDEAGENVIAEPDDMMREVHRYFADIFGSDGSGDRNPADPVHQSSPANDARQGKLGMSEDEGTLLMSPIVPGELQAALRCMGKGKASSDHVPAEALQVLHEADSKMLLGILNRVMATRGRDMPRSWRSNIVVWLIPKDPSCAGVCPALKSMRPISLLEVGYRVFATVLLRRILWHREHVVQRPLHHASQSAFQRHRTTMEPLWTVGLLMDDAVRHDNQLRMVSLDVRKTFDHVPHAALWQALCGAGYDGSVPDMLATMYNKCSCRVATAFGLGSPIDLDRGTKQGGRCRHGCGIPLRTCCCVTCGLVGWNMVISLESSGYEDRLLWHRPMPMTPC